MTGIFNIIRLVILHANLDPPQVSTTSKPQFAKSCDLNCIPGKNYHSSFLAVVWHKFPCATYQMHLSLCQLSVQLFVFDIPPLWDSTPHHRFTLSCYEETPLYVRLCRVNGSCDEVALEGYSITFNGPLDEPWLRQLTVLPTLLWLLASCELPYYRQGLVTGSCSVSTQLKYLLIRA